MFSKFMHSIKENKIILNYYLVILLPELRMREGVGGIGAR